MSEQNNNISGIPSCRTTYKRTKNETKRIHTVSEPFEERKEKYLELREMRQKIKLLRAEKLQDVNKLLILSIKKRKKELKTGKNKKR